MNAPEVVTDDGAGQQLVKSVSIENLVNQRAAVIEKIEAGLELLRDAYQLAQAANVGFPRFKIDESKYDIGNIMGDRVAEVSANVQKIVDRGAWGYLMNESGLRTFMDAKARHEWDESIEKGNYPALTAATVEATFQGLYGARGEMFERGVIACFKRLSWNYKTNLPQKFGKRIVMTYLRSAVTGGGSSLGWVNHRNIDELDDLMRVFHVLDGKPEPDHRHAMHQLISACRLVSDPDPENEFVRIKCYRNGNGHATFKRLDLVEQMNRIIAKHFPGALPAPK